MAYRGYSNMTKRPNIDGASDYMCIVSEAKRCKELIKFNIHNDNLTFKGSSNGAPIYIKFCNHRTITAVIDTISGSYQDSSAMMGCNRGAPL